MDYLPLSSTIKNCIDKMTEQVSKAILRQILMQRVLMALVVLAVMFGCVSAQNTSADVSWLIESLELKQGSVVADIGAGEGEQTLAIARHIGPEGLIYSTELGETSVEELQEEIKNSDLGNITVVEGHPNRTNLPKACCDALYMRRVYHHFGDPPAMNASLFSTLKPGGKLAIIDFAPRGSESEPGERASGGSHGVTMETVIKEVTAVGFVLLQQQEKNTRHYYLLFQKPAEQDEDE